MAPAANGHVHSLELAAAPAAPGSTRHALQDQQHLQEQQQEEHALESITPKQSKFDSLDYEVVENTVYRTDAAARTHLDHIMESGVKWTICFALGKVLGVTLRTCRLSAPAGFQLVVMEVVFCMVHLGANLRACMLSVGSPEGCVLPGSA